MQEKLQRIVRSSAFGNSILGVILLAGVLVGLETSPEIMAAHGDLIHVLDKVVLWIFAIEVVMKIGSHGRRPFDYYKDPWNVFDFVIVAVCFLPFNAQYVAVLRLARVLRVLRLLTVVPRLQLLVGALLRSIPSMFYVTILLFLLFYIYAVLGTMIFGGNDPVHFGTLGLSMLSLFRVVTLEDWTDIMYINMYGSDSYAYPPEALANASPQAFGLLAVVFFVSFVLLGTMVMLNLFIGVIMTGMMEAQEELDAMEEASGTPSKVGDYSAFIAEMKHLERQVEELRARLKTVKRHAPGEEL